MNIELLFKEKEHTINTLLADGGRDDTPMGIAAISTTEYVVTGHTESTDGLLGTPKGQDDVWVFKIKLK